MTKTPFLQFAGLTLWGALSMFTLPNQAFAGDEDLQDFVTETGRCSLTEKAELLAQKDALIPSYSYTLDDTKIHQSRGISQKIATIIPPLTRLHCLARNNEKMLVTAADPTKAYCGWVKIDSLLEASDNYSVLMRSSLEPCGVIKPIPWSDFCAKMKEILGVVEGCALKSVGRSVLNTKFITDHADTGTDKITLYSSAQSMEAFGKLGIFTNLGVF